MANSKDFFPSSLRTRANAQIKVSFEVNSTKLSLFFDNFNIKNDPLILSDNSSYKSSIYSSSLSICVSSVSFISDSGLSLSIVFILSEKAVCGRLVFTSLRVLKYCKRVTNSSYFEAGIKSHFCINSFANSLISVDSFKLFIRILI